MDLASLRSLLKSDDRRASAALEALVAFEQQDWLTVFDDQNSDEEGELRLACFLKPDAVEDALRNSSFELDSGEGRPGFVGYSDGEGGWNVEYLTIGSEEVVPLLFHRYFSGPFPNVVELAEDFRLSWDLYEDRDRGRFVTTDEVGDVITVAEWRDGDLRLNKRYLRRYQAARQLALSLQLVVDRRGGDEIAHLTDVNVDVAEGQYRLAYHGGSGLTSGERPNFTRLLGKRVIPPPPIERCELWPYEPARQYETFTVGTDDEGEPITHISDPDTLANYFGKNPDAPHYLTPVFFERRVLDKYHADTDRYEVSDRVPQRVWRLGLADGQRPREPRRGLSGRPGVRHPVSGTAVLAVLQRGASRPDERDSDSAFSSASSTTRIGSSTGSSRRITGSRGYGRSGTGGRSSSRRTRATPI